MSSKHHTNTIFLTPDEDERMRRAFKNRRKNCQEIAGQPRVPSDPNDHQNQITMAALMSDMAATPKPGQRTQTAEPDSMVAFAIDPYPPSIALLQDLQPMKLSELHMETHHRGRVLTVRRLAPVVKLVAYSWTVVQEEFSDDTERLEVWLHKSQHGRDILELGSAFQVKEPYFTLSDQGEPTLRINHPSDLVVCPDGLCTDSLPSSTNDIATASLGLIKTAKEYKEEGNAALKQQDLWQAYMSYTKGLQSLTADGRLKEELIFDLFRNRAHVNLVLNRFDEAKSDAIASLSFPENVTHKGLDGKAYFRAGSAAYKLGDFQEAKRFSEEQQRLTPEDKGVIANIRRTKLRLHEQTTGVYDFKKLKAGLLAHPRVDAANFIGKTKVGESLGRGRGMFATRNMASDEIILCEKAFCAVWGHENEALAAITYDDRDDRIRFSPIGLDKSIVQKLLNNPSQVGKVLDLYGDHRGIGKQLIMRDSGPVVDTFQIHDIVARNAFGLGPVYTSGHRQDEATTNADAGLWILAAYINHSCIPNATKECIGDLMVLRASRPIKAGEEITHSYDGSSYYDARTAVLMNTWGFTCTCALCVAEKADGPALRKKRRELESEADSLIATVSAVRAQRLSISKAKRLARSIDDTYDEERYNGLPRMALLGIQKWLVEATGR